MVLDWFINVLLKYPESAVFLAVGLGFIIGKIKIGFFSLGSVASVLLVGLLIGQIGLEIPGPMKSAFFLLFLFTTGYAVGPQFFQALATNGIKQVVFAFTVCIMCFISVLIVAKLAGYNVGQAGGLFAGSQTISGALGVIPETIAHNPLLSKEQIDLLVTYIPVCYSVTYIFGAAGSAFILAIVGPRLLGGLKSVKNEVKKLEADLNDQSVTDRNPTLINALRPVTFRAYHVSNIWFTEKQRSVADLELRFLNQNERLYVARIRHDNIITYATPKTIIYPEDDIVLSGRREYAMDLKPIIGPEIADYELLNFPAEQLNVMVSKNSVAGKSVFQILLMDYMYGVSIKKITRSGLNIKVRLSTEIVAGDIIRIVGLPSDVERASPKLGIVDRETNFTNMIFLGLGIVLGVYLGSFMIKTGRIPISLGTSGGVLLTGLFMGWLRSKKPIVSAIPDASIWVLRTIGLSMYVAVIGIVAAPNFTSALNEIGWSIIGWGALATAFPLFSSIYIGKYLFKMKSPMILGCIAGSRTSTPSLGAITDQLNSDIPTIGYSITYAVGVVINLIGALLIVLVLS